MERCYTLSFKIIAVADIHMSNKLSYAQPLPNQRGLTDRLADQMHLWERMYAAALRNKVDALFVLGDLFDRPTVDAVTLTYTTAAVMNSPVPVYILPGNHDANSIRGGRFTVEAFSHMGKPKCHEPVEVIGEAVDGKEDIDVLQIAVGKGQSRRQLEFWPIGFRPVAETKAVLQRFRKKLDKNNYNVLLLHNSILGAEHLGWECDDGLEPDEVCQGFDQVLAGHFHLKQNFGDIGMYLGAPMHHHFGDAGRPAGFWVIEWPGGDKEPVMQFIDGGAPEFHVFESLKKPSKQCGVKSGDYVRYEIEVTHPEWIKRKPVAQAICDALKAEGIHASFKQKPIAQHEARLGEKDIKKAAAMSMEKAIGKYVKATGVVTSSLDLKRLREMGREILESARGTHGAG